MGVLCATLQSMLSPVVFTAHMETNAATPAFPPEKKNGKHIIRNMLIADLHKITSDCI